MRRRRRLPLRLGPADARPGRRPAQPRRRRHLNPRPKDRRPARSHTPRTPRMRPRRSVVDRVLPSETANPRPVVRLRVVGLVVAALFSLMLVRLWYLQVLDTTSYAQAVTANQVRDVEIPAPRGLILDRNGTTLVGNTSTEDVTLSQLSAEQHPEVVGQLAALLNVPSSQIEADLNNPQNSQYKPVTILENAPLSVVSVIRENPAEYPGVEAVADTTRNYPLGTTGAQVFGYTRQITQAQLKAHKNQGYQNGDLYGQDGLELQYQAELRGAPGVDPVEVDAKGEVVGRAGAQTPPRPGDDLVTNIDAGLETTLQQALATDMQALNGTVDPSTGKVVHPTGGAAVAIDPQNGAVLAMVSAPTYDPTIWNGPLSESQVESIFGNPKAPAGSPLPPAANRALDGLYTPGSTFKLATASAALKDGLWSPGQYYDDTGQFVVAGCQAGGAGCAPLHDNDGEVGGEIDISRALTISSDTFFYNLGQLFWEDRGQVGTDGIQQVANAYGYGSPTGIDLPYETDAARVDSPQVVAKEHAQDPKDYPDGSWYTGNNVEMAFGQGGTVITPLEQAVAYATFANGGTRYAPQIAAGVVDPTTGKVVERFAPKVIDHVTLAPEDRAALLAGFEGAIDQSGGTAYGIFQGTQYGPFSAPPFPLSTFPLAGKTGTASGGNGTVPTSWFVAWGPVNDPEVVIAAVVENGGYGATAASPVVRQGFEYILSHPVASAKVALPPAPAPSSSAPAATTTTTAAAPAASGTPAPAGATRAATGSRRRVVRRPT